MESKKAKYVIYHNNQLNYLTIDQSLASSESDITQRWVSLGTFIFQQGSNHFVELSNKTGEANLKIGYDAIKLIRR